MEVPVTRIVSAKGVVAYVILRYFRMDTALQIVAAAKRAQPAAFVCALLRVPSASKAAKTTPIALAATTSACTFSSVANKEPPFLVPQARPARQALLFLSLASLI